MSDYKAMEASKFIVWLDYGEIEGWRPRICSTWEEAMETVRHAGEPWIITEPMQLTGVRFTPAAKPTDEQIRKLINEYLNASDALQTHESTCQNCKRSLACMQRFDLYGVYEKARKKVQQAAE